MDTKITDLEKQLNLLLRFAIPVCALAALYVISVIIMFAILPRIWLQHRIHHQQPFNAAAHDGGNAVVNGDEDKV